MFLNKLTEWMFQWLDLFLNKSVFFDESYEQMIQWLTCFYNLNESVSLSKSVKLMINSQMNQSFGKKQLNEWFSDFVWISAFQQIV